MSRSLPRRLSARLRRPAGPQLLLLSVGPITYLYHIRVRDVRFPESELAVGALLLVVLAASMVVEGALASPLYPLLTGPVIILGGALRLAHGGAGGWVTVVAGALFALYGVVDGYRTWRPKRGGDGERGGGGGNDESP